ncbi:tetratricopeptide repeat protein, partial [Prochlorococcus sp. MIT 1303]|uniref:tetratricopeptide repeat protein n=1 Tax=Prochlorococcus sp. MIT 1303 TaxID=1723647 RepID=UPI000AB2F188
LLLAQAYQNLRQFDEAIVEYKKLNINRPKNKLIPFNLGLCLLEIGDNNAAIEAFKGSIQLDGSFLTAWGNLGNALKGEGRLKEAIQATQKVLDLEPNNPTAHMNLGLIHKDLGELEQALTSTLTSLELQPDNPTGHMNLGLIYQELGQLDQALTSTLKSLELKPDNPAAHMNLGGIYKDLGELEQVLTSTLKSLELQPDNPTGHMNLGLIYQELGQLDPALASTLKSLELQPDNPTAHMNLGGIYKELGQLDHALASTLKSLELKSDSPAALTNLGGIYQELGELDQALTSTLKSLELKPDNPTANMSIGSIYKDLGQLDQALASTLKSLELQPDNPAAHMNLGAIYQDLGKLDQALSSTLKSLELKPDNPAAHKNLGGIYQDLGKLDQALASLRVAMKSEKTKEEAAIELALIYYGMSHYHDGVKAISEIHSKTADNLLLSLYLCLDEKLEFNRCAGDLIGKRWLDQRGVAAIDHANDLYNQTLDNGLGGSAIDSVFIQTVNEQEFSDELIEGILLHLSNKTLQPRNQGLLVNGSQTSGNILDIPEKPFQALKELLIQKIDNYNQLSDINTDKFFQTNWEKHMYNLKGWAIVMKKGGSLKSHNHELGWQSGTFYLQMPEKGANPEEGAIEFSHQGPRYPKGASVFKRRVIRPKARDLNIFSSSLFHRTLPFHSETQRICIAFDVTRNEKLWEASN